MIISHKTQNLELCKDISDLLCQIDVKLAKVSELRYISDRFGTKVCIDYDVFHILDKYRQILLDKANNSECLKKYLIDDIISNIKQYLSSGKIHRLSPTTSSKISQSGHSSDVIENGINMTVIYKNYGDHNVHNSVFNKFVTGSNGDCWNQTDW